jgi:ABC-type phosphate/phosphonate transport system permease subunit
MEMGPVDALRASGANRLQFFLHAVLPVSHRQYRAAATELLVLLVVLLAVERVSTVLTSRMV